MFNITPENIPRFYPTGFDLGAIPNEDLKIVTNYGVRKACADYLEQKHPNFKGREIVQKGIQRILIGHIDDDTRLLTEPLIPESMKPRITANIQLLEHVVRGESSAAFLMELSRRRRLAISSLLLGLEDALLAKDYGVGEVQNFILVRINYPKTN